MTCESTRVGELGRNARFVLSFLGLALTEDPARLLTLAGRRFRVALRATLHRSGMSVRAAARHRSWWSRSALRPRPASPRRPPGTTPSAPAAPPPPRPADVRIGSAPAPGVRVLHHLTNSLPHTQSGYTLRSHQLLLAQRAAGIDVHATTRAGYPLTIGVLTARHTDVVDAVAYRRLIPATVHRDRDRRLAEATDLLVAAARDAGAQVLHTTTPAATGEVARAAAARLGLPWVYEVRGLPEETWAASFPSAATRAQAAASDRFRELRDAETALARTADAVVTLSGTLRDELVSRGVLPGRIHVLPNAVPVELLTGPHPTRAQARELLALPPGGVLVGAVSSLVDYEGQDTILRTVALLRTRGVDATAVIVGDGVSHPALAGLARDLRLGSHAILPGRVPPRAARLYLAALDAVLIPRRPDRVAELVTPLKPVEAMAAGCPVIASDLPALAEACGGAGVLLPPEDVEAWAEAVRRLVTDRQWRQGRIDAGRTVAIGRTWEALAAASDEIYRRLVHRPPTLT